MNNHENDIEIIVDEDNNEVDDVSNRIYEIDVRCQEIEVMLENYDFELSEKGNELFTEEEYENLLAEYKQLKKEKRELLKTKRVKTIWDEIPLWMAVYMIAQLIFSFYFVQALLSMHLANFLTRLFSVTSGVVYDIFSFILPTLSLIASLVILLLLRNKKLKKFFFFFCFVQLAETLITVGLMLWIILK